MKLKNGLQSIFNLNNLYYNLNMGRDNNAIIGYGFLISKKDYEEDESENDDEKEFEDKIEEIEKYCKSKNLDFIHDMYWSDYEIFIGIKKHKVQNGDNTYSTKHGWNSKKDILTFEPTISFNIDETEYENIQSAYVYISKKKEKNPRWMLFTYNS